MYILLGIIGVFSAGIINSTFVIPTKHIRKIPQSVMWFIFGFVGFIICNILFYLFLDGTQLDSFFLSRYLPKKYILILIPCCMGWGVGLVCFCYAVKYIGIGVALPINIGIGTAGCALLSLICVHPKKLFTISGLLIMLAVILFVIGVILYGIAANRRDKINRKNNLTNKYVLLGIFLSFFCGMLMALQGTSYIYCVDGIVDFTTQRSMFWINCAPLAITYLMAGIPYCLYYLIQSLRMSSSLIQDVRTVFTDYTVFKEVMLSALMGVTYFFSGAIVFSTSVAIMPERYSVLIAVPVYVISIAIGSNIWGFVYNEWQGCDRSIISKVLYGLILFVMAIVIIGISSYIDIFNSA